MKNVHARDEMIPRVTTSHVGRPSLDGVVGGLEGMSQAQINLIPSELFTVHRSRLFGD